ncbi:MULTISPECIES: hypothetical protein [unclassified Nocardioides]|uniref:hypothetical protein n=1 Tax=unclassified Nocardioides TaxID=2615069 RepID=UPI0009EF8113|nr:MULTISPECIES: hypothetical protein [unclassified Nocardioides]GAW47922.1 Amidohydrolase [Nocardioides sp. PD653-B2]GAW53775.1 Amidohydrolase [Nocardioides sp. PD653]
MHQFSTPRDANRQLRAHPAIVLRDHLAQTLDAARLLRSLLAVADKGGEQAGDHQ